MPFAPPHACNEPGCHELTTDRYCEKHSKSNSATEQRRAYDQRRGSSTQRGYDARWQRYTKSYLREHPLCVDPSKRHPGVIVVASEVDHIKPHRGDPVLFWDPENHQGLCHSCHSYKTATEDGGFRNSIADYLKP